MTTFVSNVASATFRALKIHNQYIKSRSEFGSDARDKKVSVIIGACSVLLLKGKQPGFSVEVMATTESDSCFVWYSLRKKKMMKIQMTQMRFPTAPLRQ